MSPDVNDIRRNHPVGSFCIFVQWSDHADTPLCSIVFVLIFGSSLVEKDAEYVFTRSIYGMTGYVVLAN